MAKKHAKRFYKNVSVEAQDGGYAIHLDGRTLKTPGKIALILPRRHYADLIAQEWQAQEEHIRPETMPVTRLMNVAMERTPDHRADLIKEVRAYTGSDVTCYRATSPRELVALQAQAWDEPLVFLKDKLGAELITTQGIVAITQDAAALDAFAGYADAQDNITLTLLTHFTAVFGSSVLAVCVMEGFMSAQEALDASRVDERYQITQWGEDEEAQIRTANIQSDTLALSHILKP